ncbi:hypothetical protein PR048_031549 [Dryococelus australis]|uniref:Maturase n=1 Tax=Dryococelus australis TaxID=614101 RepID=A0ABQ9G8A1_9NEOP|nr:hypothetical protein PR048_031549 [Dryococelus australis]
MTVIEVIMEQRRNERAGETGENLPTNGIVEHNSHMRKSGIHGAEIAFFITEKPHGCGQFREINYISKAHESREKCRPLSKTWRNIITDVARRSTLDRPRASSSARGKKIAIGVIAFGTSPLLRNSHMGIVPDDATGRRVFSRVSRFHRPCISALLHTNLTSPSSALNTSILRADLIPTLSTLLQNLDEYAPPLQTHTLKCLSMASTGIQTPARQWNIRCLHRALNSYLFRPYSLSSGANPLQRLAAINSFNACGLIRVLLYSRFRYRPIPRRNRGTLDVSSTARSLEAEQVAQTRRKRKDSDMPCGQEPSQNSLRRKENHFSAQAVSGFLSGDTQSRPSLSPSQLECGDLRMLTAIDFAPIRRQYGRPRSCFLCALSRINPLPPLPTPPPPGVSSPPLPFTPPAGSYKSPGSSQGPSLEGRRRALWWIAIPPDHNSSKISPSNPQVIKETGEGLSANGTASCPEDEREKSPPVLQPVGWSEPWTQSGDGGRIATKATRQDTLMWFTIAFRGMDEKRGENKRTPEFKGVWGEGGGGIPEENPPPSGIVRHDSDLRKSWSDPAGN